MLRNSDPAIGFVYGLILALASVFLKRLALIFQNPSFVTSFFCIFANNRKRQTN